MIPGLYSQLSPPGCRRWSAKLLPRAFACLLTLVLLCLPASGENLLTEARDRLANGEHEVAAGLLQRHLDHSAPSAALYYEIGQAWSASDREAEAALAYFRALLLDPAFTPAREALGAVNRELGIPTTRADWRARLAGSVPLDELVAVAAVTLWSGAALLLVPLFQSKWRGRFFAGGGLLLVLGCSVVILCHMADPRNIHTRDVMILQGAGSSLYRTPTDDPAGKITTLGQGSVIHVLGTSGRWFHGELPGGQRGWFLQEGSSPVVPPLQPN